MTREHLETALEALEFQGAALERQLARQPKQRNRVANKTRIYLLQCLNTINEARAALLAAMPPRDARPV